MKGGMMVPVEESPPKAHKPFVEARRAQIEHHRELKDREYTSVHEENRHLRDEVKDLDRIVKLVKEENRRLLRELKEKAKDNDWLRTLLTDETSKLKAVEASKDKLRREADEAKSVIAEVKATLATKDATIDSLKDEVVAANKAHQDVQEQCEALEKEVANAQRRVEEVRKEEAAKAKSLQDEVAAVTRQLRSVERTLEESDARVDAAEAKVKDAEKRGEERCEALRKKIAALKKLDEDAWSGSDDSDGAPKRRKAVRPNPAAIAAQKAQADLETKLKALESDRESALAAANESHAAIRAERDSLHNEKAALEASKAAAIAALESKLAKTVEEHTAEVKRRKAAEADLRSELASKVDDLSSEKQLRNRIQDELSDAHDEIARLNEKVEEAKTTAIQLEQAKEQRRVADDFTSRATHDLALRISQMSEELKAMSDDRDDAVELARSKALQLADALERCEALQDEIDSLRDGNDARDGDEARLFEEMERLKMAIAAERVAREEADAARDLQSRSTRGLDDAVAHARRENEELRMDLAARDADIADLRAALDAEMVAKADLQAQLDDERNAAADDGMNRSMATSTRVMSSGGDGDDAQLVTDHRAQIAALEAERDEAIDSATAWKTHADAVEQQREEALKSADEASAARCEAAERRASEAEARAAELEAKLTSQAEASATAASSKLATEKEALAAQHAQHTARLEREKADLLNRLKAAEAKTKEVDKSLDAKVAQIRKEQEAQRALKAAHDKELRAHEQRARDDAAKLQAEMDALRAKLEQADARARTAQEKASAAQASEQAAQETLAKLRETQMHW